MRRQVGLGAAVGLVVSMRSWSSNSAAHLVSIFPDGLTFILLAILVAAAVRSSVRMGEAQGLSATLRIGMTIGAAAGVVFGSSIGLLGTFQFSGVAPGLLAFGFLTAFGSALACGAVSAVLVERLT